MKYCSECGQPVSHRVPSGDNLPRYICDTCNTIHYQNPRIVAGTLPVWEDKILLCKRAIEPRYGLWTLPAGFMENGETTVEAASRESMEEANAIIDQPTLFTLFNLPHINQVYMLFLGELRDGKASPGPESLEVDLYTEDRIPWEQLAFPVISETLKLYFSDRKRQQFDLHTGDIFRDEQNRLTIRHH